MNKKEVSAAAKKYYNNDFEFNKYFEDSIKEAFIAGARWREDKIRQSVPENDNKILVHIVKVCCKICYVTYAEACSDSRSFNVVLARQMYMYIARENTNCTAKQIGKVVNLSHPTVLHHLLVVKDHFREKNKTYIDTYNLCLKELKGHKNE